MAKLIIEYNEKLNKITKTLEYRGIQYSDNDNHLYKQIASDFIIPDEVYNAILNIDNTDFSEIKEIYEYEKIMEEGE